MPSDGEPAGSNGATPEPKSARTPTKRAARRDTLRSVSSAKQAEARKGGGGVQGDLAEMPLADFFRVLSLDRKTCKVAIESPQGQGQVFFEQGTPVAAYIRDERGREAFAEVVTWSEGSFALTVGAVAQDHNLERGLEALLLQGTWQESSVGHDTGPGVMFTPEGA